jgi:N-acetylglutamate synthase-like GNAT family acetyltransferase
MEGTPPLQVKRIDDSDAQSAYCCMTEVPTPWPKAVCQCRDWVSEHLGEYVDGYHLRLESGRVIGHIYFASSENALFSYDVEPGVGVLYCEWIQQQYQKRGLGKRLFDAFLSDMEEENTKGVLVETTDLEGQMHYSHYVSRGFNIVHETGHHKLLYLPLSKKVVAYRRRVARVRPKRGFPVEILLFRGFVCPYEVSTQILVREIALEFGDQVTIQEISITQATLEKYGVASGIFINGKHKLAGGEPESAVRQAIIEEL